MLYKKYNLEFHITIFDFREMIFDRVDLSFEARRQNLKGNGIIAIFNAKKELSFSSYKSIPSNIFHVPFSSGIDLNIIFSFVIGCNISKL